MREVYRLLEPYGAKEPEPREQQPSYYLLNMDLEGYRQTAVLFPAFLLLAASLALYTVLRRLVESQRPLIGFLRASGFSRRQVVVHYMAFPLIIGAIGGLLGLALGQALSVGITTLYLGALNIPLLTAPFRWSLALSGVLLSMSICLIGGAGPATAVARLLPSEALRDLPAAPGRHLLVERLIPVLRRAGAMVKLPLRNLARRPVRSFWMVLGIAAAASLVIVAGSWRDAMDEMKRTYFDLMRAYDLEVSFSSPQTEHQVLRVRHWPGVWRAEGILAVPVEVVGPNDTISTTLMGVEPNSRLLNLFDPQGRRLRLESNVVLVSTLLRRKLGVRTGDRLLIRYAFQTNYRRGEIFATVGPPLRLPVGQSLYMPLSDVRRAFRDALDLPPSAINSIIIRAKPSARLPISRRLHDLPFAISVSSLRQTEKDIDEQMAFMNVFVGVMTAFGAMLAVSVIYATVSVSLLERRRELAALRAEGFSNAYLVELVSVENIIVWLLGIIVGLPCGTKLALALLSTYVTESFELAQVVFPRTLYIAAAATLASVAFSQWWPMRYILRLDVAQVLRFRE